MIGSNNHEVSGERTNSQVLCLKSVEDSKRLNFSLGFSLTEVMFAMAILIIFVGLLVPALNKSKVAAKGSICMSNMRQIGMGLSAFSVEHEGCLPHLATNSSTEFAWDQRLHTWPGIAWNYFSIGPWVAGRNELYQRNTALPRSIFKCPMSDMNQPKYLHPLHWPDPGASLWNCYAISSDPATTNMMLAPLSTEGLKVPINRLWIRDPGKTALLVEVGTIWTRSWDYNRWYGMVPHNMGMNVLYYDGRMEWLTFNNVPVGWTNQFWCGR